MSTRSPARSVDASMSLTNPLICAGSMPALSAVSTNARRRPSFQAPSPSISLTAVSRVARISRLPLVGERMAIAIDPTERSAEIAGRSPDASTSIAAGSGT